MLHRLKLPNHQVYRQHHNKHSCRKSHLSLSKAKCPYGLVSRCLAAADVDEEEPTYPLANEPQVATRRVDKAMLAVADVEADVEAAVA